MYSFPVLRKSEALGPLIQILASKNSSNKCIASTNRCLTSSNKKLLGAPGIATRNKKLLEDLHV